MNRLPTTSDSAITEDTPERELVRLTDEAFQCFDGESDDFFGPLQERTGETQQALEQAVAEAAANC